MLQLPGLQSPTTSAEARRLDAFVGHIAGQRGCLNGPLLSVEATEQVSKVVRFVMSENAQEPRLTFFEQGKGPLLRRYPRCGRLDKEGSAVLRMPNPIDEAFGLQVVQEQDHRALVDAERRTHRTLGHRLALCYQSEDPDGASRETKLAKDLVSQGRCGDRIAVEEERDPVPHRWRQTSPSLLTTHDRPSDRLSHIGQWAASMPCWPRDRTYRPSQVDQEDSGV